MLSVLLLVLLSVLGGVTARVAALAIMEEVTVVDAAATPAPLQS